MDRQIFAKERDLHVALTEEQELLRHTATALAANIGAHNPSDLVDRGPDGTAWRLLAEAGLLGLRVPEAAGGAGASGVEVMVVAEALGAASSAAPFLGSAVLASGLLVLAGADRNAELLERLASGATRAAVALDGELRGPGSSVAWDAEGAETALVVDGDDVAAVPLGGDRVAGADLSRTLVRIGDVRRAAPVGRLDQAARTRWEALALASLSADLLGVMTAALDAVVGYVKERVQFGVPVGSFQAVQHLLADQLVTVEGARSAVAYAAWAVDELEPPAALLAARTAKAYCGEAGRAVTEAAIQAYGGIGMTWECMAHIHLRRALLDRQTLGDEHAQLSAIAEARLGAAA